MSNVIDRIILLKEERRLSSKEVEDGAGLASSSISQWKKGKGKPGLESIMKLALFFHVSADYLIGLSDQRDGAAEAYASERNPENVIRESQKGIDFEISLSEDERVLLCAFRNISSLDRFRVIQQCMNALDAIHVDPASFM